MPKSRWIILLLTLCLAACSGGGGAAGSSPGIAVPILSGTRSPADVVTGFLDAWKAADYNTMYTVLSPQSQTAYSLPVFQTTYTDNLEKVNITDITYTLKDTTLQGMSALVTYDLAITSPNFGTIEDNDRKMRLVQMNGNWGIAWSSMDIFEGLVAGARIQIQAQRQPRANIYDRNGQPLVEQGATMIALYGSQQNMPSVDDCLDLLARVLVRRRVDIQNLFALYNPDTVFYMGEIDSDMDAREGTALDETCAVSGRYPRETREYVGYGGAVHVTGYIGQIPADQVDDWRARGYDGTELVGLNGVESAYESQLAGQPEQVLQIVSPSGVLLRELAGKQGVDPQPVTLTIDRNLQLATGQAIADAYTYAQRNWAAPGISPGAGAVVIDVKTGGILAMSSFPWFDPGIFNPDTPALALNPNLIANLFNDERQPFNNRAVQEQYFPGSTFKIITTTAAANERLITPLETFFCGLEWNGTRFGDTASPRYDWRKLELPDSPTSQPAGDITMSQALTASCNPFFYEMGARLFLERGEDVLVSYARRMGLGVKTEIDVLDEAAGALPATTSVEQAINEAIGQGGIQVTILQMARMVAAVANGGTLYRPYLVQQVGGADGMPVSYEGETQAVGNLNVNDGVLDVVKAGMCAVTTDTTLGTAYFDFYDTPYTVCGKTGTAQTGRTEPHGWFVAFAPADDPQIAVAVMVEYSREGSETAGPIVRRILDSYFNAVPYPYPEWWYTLDYIPLEIPENMTGG